MRRESSEETDGGGGVADGGGDGVHAAEDLFDDGAAVACSLGSVACGFGSGLGVAGDLRDGGGHLLHGGGGLLGLLALLIHATVDLVAGGAHGRSTAGERARGLDDGADDAGEVVLHLLHRDGEGPDLVLTV